MRHGAEDDEGEESVTFEDAKVIAETAMALKIECEELNSQPVWIPRSVIHDDSEISEKDDEGTLALKRWFAEKEGFA